MIRTVTVRTSRAARSTGGTRAARRDRRARATVVRQRFVRLAAEHSRPQPDPAPVHVRAAAAPATMITGTVKPDAVKPDAAPEVKPGGHTLSTSGGGDQWHGACSCGEWATTTRAMKREASVKGAHTRHVNAAG